MDWSRKHNVSLDVETFSRLSRIRVALGLRSVAEVIRFFSRVAEGKAKLYVIEDENGRFIGSFTVSVVGGRAFIQQVSGPGRIKEKEE